MMRCNRHYGCLVSEQVHRVVECKFIKLQSSGSSCGLHEEMLGVDFSNSLLCVV